MKQELKNCPFCDGKATLIQQTNSYVQCEECLASTSTSCYEDVAINAWNTRPDHSGEIVEINWEQRRWDVHRDANKIAMNVILMAQFEVSKSDPDLAKQIDWKKMAEASMEFANEVSQNVVESYQLKQQSDEE